MMNAMSHSCHALTGLLLTLVALLHAVAASAQTPPSRPRVGVALGGGSARGLAHVGVLRWLEEHRIPIDVVAGTSMGGLIGGSYATGMSPDEVEGMLAEIDWTVMFDSSDFPFQSVRRKRDSRAYPAYLEFGLKGGFSVQTSLNGGQQVDLLTRLSVEGSQEDAAGVQFFTAIKSMTISGYYSTEIGLRQELGNDGVLFLPVFTGCTHPEHQV